MIAPTKRDIVSAGPVLGSLPGDPGDGDSLAKDGLKLVGICKQQADFMERRYASPIPIYGQAFSKDGWRQVEAILGRKERKCQIDAHRERYRAMRLFVKRMPAEASPWDAMVAVYEMWFHTRIPVLDGMARAILRDACYAVTMAFAGRN